MLRIEVCQLYRWDDSLPGRVNPPPPSPGSRPPPLSGNWQLLKRKTHRLHDLQQLMRRLWGHFRFTSPWERPVAHNFCFNIFFSSFMIRSWGQAKGRDKNDINFTTKWCPERERVETWSFRNLQCQFRGKSGGITHTHIHTLAEDILLPNCWAPNLTRLFSYDPVVALFQT